MFLNSKQFQFIWLMLVVCALIIFFSSTVPIEKYQKNYINFVKKINSAPITRIERLENDIYSQEVQNGNNKQNKQNNKSKKNDYKKPLYIRDKNNHYILHKVK